MKLKVKKLTDTAKLPTKANPGDAGFDLYADEDFIPFDGGLHEESTPLKVVSTGISLELPLSTFGIIATRSSTASKLGMFVTGGIIDNGYRGEIKVIINTSFSTPLSARINKGDKIAQLLILPLLEPEIEEVSDLSSSVRGEKGFGSSDK